MRLFGSGLDRAVRESLIAAYAQQRGRRPGRLIAAGRGEQGWCVLLPDVLAIGVDDSWRFIGWHQILRGGWNAQNSELRWELVGGEIGNLVLLEDPGMVPEAFAERVAASIVVQQHVDVPETREGAVISARRDLGDRDAPLQWQVRRGRGTPDTTEVRAQLDGQLQVLKADYDF